MAPHKIRFEAQLANQRIVTELRIAVDIVVEFCEDHPEHAERFDRLVQALLCVADNMKLVRQDDAADGG